jgi:N4-(beta-N-acetylglucosaminyl)-L-asparaginase
MNTRYSRRDFLKNGAAFGAASVLAPAGGILAGTRPGTAPAEAPAGMMRVVASANGLRATERAMAILRRGGRVLDAVIAGVNIVEEDPNDMSVGYGGLPNEDGVVQLDASVMDGPTHASGAVGAIENIKNPSKVAKLVMERTNHCLLAGEGALRFALAHGFKKENLLTDAAREAWLKWKEALSDRDNWLPPAAVNKLPPELQAYLMTSGTINCLGLDADGNLAGVTTTSGLSWKIPGRVGDSPIIGAGLYVDNEVGAAGSTGLGEANIRNLGSFQVVQFMAQGMSPEQACLKALERTAAKMKLTPRFADANGRPNFGLSFYALNKKGEFGSAAYAKGARFAVHDGTKNGLREAACLYP